MPDKLPPEFIKRLKSVQAKRPRTVIEHILKHGSVSTEELRDLYGYSHAPRAARDVREQGIPLRTIKVTGSDGRKIAAYEFNLDENLQNNKAGGRRTFSKKLKDDLLAAFGSKCAVCHQSYEARYLQIDHCIPYEVAGDNASDGTKPEDFLLLCGSCNRAKSWSCEHCSNRKPTVCSNCYWAAPMNYKHIATEQARRVDLTWQGEDVANYKNIAAAAKDKNMSIRDYIKLKASER